MESYNRTLHGMTRYKPQPRKTLTQELGRDTDCMHLDSLEEKTRSGGWGGVGVGAVGRT